jgi:alkenylglycerophosphocholine/alkenylglycerophosphoethanolamine hydrolase
MTYRRPLVYVSIACAVVYLATTPWRPYPGSAVFKGGVVGALTVLAFLARGWKRDARLLALGLAFSTAGDVLLDLSPQWFFFGLAAFLLAHIAYISLYVRNAARPLALSPALLVSVVLVIAYSATLSVWIVPSVGPLAVPVVLYICAITVMVVTAMLARFDRPWVALGAVLFLISDSLLATDKFKTPVPLRDYLVDSTYFLGQYGIALGFLSRSS